MAPPTLEELQSKDGFFLDLPDTEFETKIPLKIEGLEQCLEGFPDYEDLKQIKIKKNRAFIRPRDEFSGDDYKDPVSHPNKLKNTWFWILADTKSKDAAGISYQKQFQTEEGVKVGTAHLSACHVGAKIYVYERHRYLDKLCKNINGWESIFGENERLNHLSSQDAAVLMEIIPEGYACILESRDPLDRTKSVRLNKQQESLDTLRKAAGNVRGSRKFQEGRGGLLADGIDEFLDPLKNRRKLEDPPWYKDPIFITILGTFSFVGILQIKEWWTGRKTAQLMDKVSDVLRDAAREEIRKNNFATDLADMDPTTRKVVVKIEEGMRPVYKRRGKYNEVMVAPNGWGKDGVRFPLVVRNPGVEHRDTSDERARGIEGGQFVTVEQQVHSRLPEVLRKYQKKAPMPLVPFKILAPWNLVRPWQWRQLIWGRQVEFQYDEMGRMKTTEEYGKLKKTVFLKWLNALSNGTMRVTGFTTPPEAIDLWRQASHDATLKPLINRFKIVWADPKSADDVVINLKRGEKSYREEGYQFEIEENAYQLIAKAGRMKHVRYRIPQEDLWIMEGSPYVIKQEAIGVMPDEFDGNKQKNFFELTLDQGHVLRSPIAIWLDVVERKVTNVSDKSENVTVTYDDVAGVIAEKYPEEVAVLAEFYPDDISRAPAPRGPSADSTPPKAGAKDGASEDGVKANMTEETGKAMFDIYRNNESLLGQESTVMTLVEQARMSYDPASGKTLAEWAVRYVDMHFIAQEKAGRAVDARIREARERRGISEKDFDSTEMEKVMRFVEHSATHGVGQ